MSNFALIGASGFIAPRHLHAIHATDNRLVAALDPSDSVGILDSYFPDSAFFTEFERFDRHVYKLARAGEGRKVDFVSICSPNYLHDSHVRFALRSDADAICEKPLVLNPWNVDGLAEIEASSGRRINTILQLRVHPAIVALRDKIDQAGPRASKYEIDLDYVTSRGQWYLQSWKGDDRRSGGIATNIGVHFFDMLHYLFGARQHSEVHRRDPMTAAGYLEFEDARVRWFLSIDENNLPQAARNDGQRTYRSITVDGEEIEFSGGFTDLHTASYQRILAGEGFGIEDSRRAIETVSQIRVTELRTSGGDQHPAVRGRTA